MKMARREVIEAFSRAEYQRQLKADTTPPVGVMEAVRLLDQRELIFQGRAYRVPSIGALEAAELLDLRERLRSAKPGARLEDVVRDFTRAAHLTKKLVRPVGFVRRLFWWWPWWNPFNSATPWQVGKNLGFFSTCLVLDRDPDIRAVDLPARGTSFPTSQPSHNATPRGATPRGGQRNGAAARSPGHTS